MMACEYICDGCGKRAPAEDWPGGLFKPSHWYERRDKDGTQIACSRECVALIAEKTKKTSLVLPF